MAKSKKWSTGAKVALGIGVAVVVAIVIAAVRSFGSDDAA